MCITKAICQSIRSLANYFYALHYAIITQHILAQVVKLHRLGTLKHAIDGVNDMFQTSAVSNWLSHR